MGLMPQKDSAMALDHDNAFLHEGRGSTVGAAKCRRYCAGTRGMSAECKKARRIARRANSEILRCMVSGGSCPRIKRDPVVTDREVI